MRDFMMLLLCVIWAATSQSQMHEEQVVLETGSGKIHGTLLLPADAVNPPVVLIIAGSGPTDRNGNFPMGANNSLKLLAEGLLNLGIASLRYDKRGVAQSAAAGPSESELRFEHYVQDAIEWTTFLKNDPRLGPLSIIGHSEGSLIGIIAAQQSKSASFISIAGAGVKASDLIRRQLEEQPSSVAQEAEPILAALVNGQIEDTVPQSPYALFRPSVQPYLISWFKYDPKLELAKLKCKTLVVQGDRDLQVSLLDAESLEKSNSKAELLLVEEMNHILKKTSENRLENLMSYTNPDLPIIEGLIQNLAGFIKN